MSPLVLAVFVGFLLLSPASQGHETEGPSESECRPYIEKALQGVNTLQGEDAIILSDEGDEGPLGDDSKILSEEGNEATSVQDDEDTPGRRDENTVNEESLDEVEAGVEKSDEEATEEEDKNTEEEIEQPSEEQNESEKQPNDQQSAEIGEEKTEETDEEETEEQVDESKDTIKEDIELERIEELFDQTSKAIVDDGEVESPEVEGSQELSENIPQTSKEIEDEGDSNIEQQESDVGSQETQSEEKEKDESLQEEEQSVEEPSKETEPSEEGQQSDEKLEETSEGTQQSQEEVETEAVSLEETQQSEEDPEKETVSEESQPAEEEELEKQGISEERQPSEEDTTTERVSAEDQQTEEEETEEGQATVSKEEQSEEQINESIEAQSIEEESVPAKTSQEEEPIKEEVSQQGESEDTELSGEASTEAVEKEDITKSEETVEEETTKIEEPEESVETLQEEQEKAVESEEIQQESADSEELAKQKEQTLEEAKSTEESVPTEEDTKLESEEEQKDPMSTETEKESVEEEQAADSGKDAPEEGSQEGAEDEKKEAPGEEAPEEEELIMIQEMPEKLRSRDHMGQILHLDTETEEIEQVLSKTVENTLKELKKLYDAAIKPLEILYKYRDLSNRHYGDPEIFSKPLILFMGPWSGGKSTIINYLLENEYSVTALRTGADPSPAYFNIVMWGEEAEIVDGTQLAADWTFSGLQKFGQGLLDRLRGLKLNHPLLQKVNIVEIPGILEIRKQVERMFPFNDACQWFIDRADIIFLVYDPSKLDIGPETEAILDQLKGREMQTRIILNKADQVKPEELMRVQGTLIWNISPLMSSTEPPVMYSTSLWSLPYEAGSPTRLLHAQEKAFLTDLRSAIDKRVENKIAGARRFAVRVRNHAKMVDCYLTTYYNHKSFFDNKKHVSDDIIEHPQNYHIYEGLSTLTNISRYDLPDPDVYRDFFRLNPVYEFQQLSATCTYFRGCPINRLDLAIAYDLPELIGKYKKSVEELLKSYNARK